MNNYPLPVIHGYEIDFHQTYQFLNDIILGKFKKLPAWKKISKNRRSLLPFGALIMKEIIEIMEPSAVSFSSFGIREGYIYSQLSESERKRDPLLLEAEYLCSLYTYAPQYSHDLVEWTGKIMPFFDIQETDEEARYRKVFCLLSNIQGHSCFRYVSSGGLDIMMSCLLFIGITHAGRAYIELVNYYRQKGIKDHDVLMPLTGIAKPRLVYLAKLLGGILRVIYFFTASMPDILKYIYIRKVNQEGPLLQFVFPKKLEELAGEKTENSLRRLSRVSNQKIGYCFE
ncbi:hypothetical protein [Liberibacter crescens]|uniref:Ppx/GppA phosphatase family protein n=1 Tax=Liberibacter crescens TaxID=1273132 RepID=UPI0009DB5CC4